MPVKENIGSLRSWGVDQTMMTVPEMSGFVVSWHTGFGVGDGAIRKRTLR